MDIFLFRGLTCALYTVRHGRNYASGRRLMVFLEAHVCVLRLGQGRLWDTDIRDLYFGRLSRDAGGH